MSSKGKSKSRRNKKTAPGLKDWNGRSAYLASRSCPAHPIDVIPSNNRWPLGWALPASLNGDTERLLTELKSWLNNGCRENVAIAESLESWLAVNDHARDDVGFGLECLAWSYALPQLAQVLSAAPWRQALDRLIEITGEAESAVASEAVLCQQLLAVELPLTLAFLFSELPACRDLAKPAKKRLTTSIHELLDGDGLPRARYLPIVRDLLACWTRACYLARAGGLFALQNEDRLVFEWFIRRSLQFTRQDGSAVFSDDRRGDGFQELFDAALTLAGDKQDAAIADQVLPGRKAARKKSERDTLFPEAAANSEWAALAVLRPNWLRGGSHLVVTFENRRIQAELNCGSTTVWSGDWTPQVSIGGRPLELTEDWEQNCWFSDDDLDYLELEAPLPGGWRIQRQILFAREDSFLFAADVVLGEHTAEIAYCSRLPLTADVTYEAAKETREGFLAGKRRRALVMPLALPEWRAEKSDGDLAPVEGALQLAITRQTPRLYAPLFIDLDRHRIKGEGTWRRLTVAEHLEIQPAENAVGYRVQVRNEQWLFYRSLTEPRNRTLLGQNLTHEFFAARFDVDGVADEMIGVDPAY